MRSFRSLFVLVALLGGVLAYLYFVDAKKPVDQTEEKPKVFAGLESDKIEELKVSTIAGGVASLQKAADGWKLTEPTAAKADESEVNGITSNLSSVTIERVVDEAPKNLGDYGLKEPVTEVSFKAKGDKAFRTLQLGTKTPTGGDMYAKLAHDKKVFLVQGYLESTFNKQPFDLRDKRILTIDRDKVDRVEVVNGDSTIALTKGAGDWKITTPVEARGDFGAIEGLVSRLQSAEMKSVATENATDLKQYGLDKPAVVATISLGSARAQLALGSKTDKGDVYARDVSKNIVVTVGSDLLTELQKGANDYRRKDVFEFRPDNVARIELTHGATSLVAEKIKTKGKDGKETETWQNAATKKPLDSAKFETLLSKLSGFRAQSFADPKAKTGLDQPALTVKATYDEGKKTETVQFGRVGTDVFAGRSSEPGAAKLDTAQLDSTLKDLDAFK
jgi:hypothetical protein